MAKSILILLMVFSIVSWAIILNKFRTYRQAKDENIRFLKTFSKTENLTHTYSFAKELRISPLARIFLTGYRELYIFQEMAKKERKRRGEPSVSGGELVTPRDLRGIGLALNKAVNREVERLSKRLEFLATTGSTTPFIGLFGTVWGIMHSFRSIGMQGTASIGGVAPGIAEALIATAAGLVAAIPAVIFFNYFNNKIVLFISVMEDFSQDFIYMAEKNFVREEIEESSFDLS
ncbi:MAG: MotA/TolQ/ExbB proton channel family protein [Nitrospinaceae bacterium]